MTGLGFLGLGTMGRPMARRLVDAGHDVVVWNRSAGPVAELVSAGARAAASPADALAADVSFCMLADDRATEDVLTGEAVAAASSRTHVMMASISPDLADRLDERFAAAGAHYVGAPVLGRPAVAAEGRLNILAAGAPSVVDAVEPYLRLMGARIWRIGARPSAANAVKAAVNYNIIHALQAIGESVAMTERQGVDPALFTELLSSTLFGGSAYSVYGDLVARRAYRPPGFRMALGRKDLGLAADVAAAGGVRLATLPALVEVFDAALADPQLRDADWSAIAEISRRSAG